MDETDAPQTPDAERLLRIYLNDHYAGSNAGVNLANRIRDSNRGTPLGDAMSGIIGEIVDDQRYLKQVMDELEVPENRLKSALATIGAAAGKLKLNGRLRGYSPLSRVLELEGLIAGVMAKRGLWASLLESRVSLRSGQGELERRHESAEDQFRRLSIHHRAAAAEAFRRSPN